MIARSVHSLSKLDRYWLTEAVRLTEAHAGLLDDAEANRRARAAGGDLSERVLMRAELLAERDGLLEAQRHWRQGAALVLAVLAVLALFTGAGLAFAALGEGSRSVNVFWALGSLLGLNLLSLIGWLIGFAGTGAGGLGRLWLWLSARFAHDARAAQLGPALLGLLTRAGLARWGFGLLVHGFWLLVMIAALVMLLALLSARRYGFNWETTLLSADSFVALTQALGSLPGLLGFPVPDPETVRASEVVIDREAARRAWAGWLLGALVVYGLLPRLLLALLCLWRWHRGVAALSLDFEQPELQVLRERLQPGGESLGVSDPAPGSLPRIEPRAASGGGAGALLVAIELDEQFDWPPPLGAQVADAGIVNSRAERQDLLDRMVAQPPARLLIACDPRRSVDRGTLKFIGELSRFAVETRVWLLQPPAVDPARLEEWREAIESLQLAVGGAESLSWLESGHD